MGIFSKKPKPRSEAAKAEAAALGPVVLELEGNRLTFEDGAWRSDYYGPIPKSAEGIERELLELRVQVKKQAAELETYAAQAERLREARERWNLLDFKYQLLMDMWTMRVLDNDRDLHESRSSKGSPRSHIH
ncbi:hypothetical protein KFL_002440150 [Klebsormidium nitens]|uniref:Uncharacterized protein n=1 Tax=Klebsormidium nitens TaxID=105231 RepID=A0A1Y1IBZ3_KLENI|nr:hypothetical protein KFL_002440150 [Klebsormidium nitens]|eukprot:GAQ85608.1 hypothetical protein KFL_002440150 [Klebsormidium nitens]